MFLNEYNPHVTKHNTSCVSLIVEEYNNPISIAIYDCRWHDSKIIKDQLNTLYK